MCAVSAEPARLSVASRVVSVCPVTDAPLTVRTVPPTVNWVCDSVASTVPVDFSITEYAYGPPFTSNLSADDSRTAVCATTASAAIKVTANTAARTHHRATEMRFICILLSNYENLFGCDPTPCLFVCQIICHEGRILQHRTNECRHGDALIEAWQTVTIVFALVPVNRADDSEKILWR